MARDVGQYTSLALDGSGYPHISYYDDIKGNLLYAYRDGSGWHILVVDTDLDHEELKNPSMDTSLALDASKYAHISYYNPRGSATGWNNGHLKYAYQDAVGWRIEIVETGVEAFWGGCCSSLG